MYPPSHIELCPDAYLFEFSGEPGQASATAEVEAFKERAKGLKSVRIRQEFSLLLNGLSAQVLDQDELQEIMSWPGLRRVTPLTIVSPPERVQSTRNPLVTSALEMTGAAQAHLKLGLKGEGILVGVIDTGIDFTHPALGGCFGKGCKVAFGHDFVGDDFNGKNMPQPSDTPMDCAGHGTHVAGIIGALDDVVIGVAPEVTLGAYRVLGCKGSSNDDTILAALERAAMDRMDIINLSIGEPNGWPLNPVARAISKLKDLGIMVTVSHGNDNSQGLFSANYVGEGPSVLAVASVINTKILLSFFTTSLNPNHRILYAKSSLPGLNTTLPMVAPINGTQFGYGCEPFHSDLTGKAKHALDKGAAGILFVNNVPGSLVYTIDPVQIPSGSMSQTEGEKLFNSLTASSTEGESKSYRSIEVVAMFSAAPEAFFNEAGGSMSVFSSFGLDNELHIKPDVSAPGEDIFSTWPVRNGSYTTLSGTSMASPHVAGALALALQQYRIITESSNPPSWSRIQHIYKIFKNTAQPTRVFNHHEPFDIFAGDPLGDDDRLDQSRRRDRSTAMESVAKQGAGLINIFHALESLRLGLCFQTKTGGTCDRHRYQESSRDFTPLIRSTIVSPPTLELNDTEHLPWSSKERELRTITIFNHGSRAIQYELSHLPAESLHEFSIESRAVKIKNQGLFNVTPPTDKGTNIVDFANARHFVARVEFSSRTVTVPAGRQRRVAITIRPPKRPSRHQHWIYSGYIVIRAASSSYSYEESVEGERTSYHHGGGDNGPITDAIHVPYAGVKGRMKSLPIFLEPTPTELKVNNQTELCQVLRGSSSYSKELMFSFQEKALPLLSFCIMNPTRLLILDLITSQVNGTGTNSSDTQHGGRRWGHGEVEGRDFQVLGRIASNEFVPRSLVSSIVSTVVWDGTLDLTDGGSSNSTHPVNRMIIHQDSDMDQIYDTDTQPSEGHGKDEVPDAGNHLVHLIQRSLRDNEHRSGPDKEQDSTPPKPSRNQHLLRMKHAKGVTGGNLITVPNGRYRLRLRALRMLGDMDNPEDYDVWITPNFVIHRKSNPLNTEASTLTSSAAEPTPTTLP
ncbi:hypothetical protein BGX31_008663 [Mortierella sp. GBA43]|nr:hypothetical protein BGX31_008663 [Mortierella sp. GBA43]